MLDDLPFEITPRQVQELGRSGEPMHLVDVRQPDEWELTHIEGSELIPMDTVPSQFGNLENMAESARLVVICHHGIRSAKVVNWLRGHGVTACQSLAGGIERWSTDVDPSVPRY
ncbi:MAG TPA: rhodanese-like domain-containing protein [Bryobacteraceae bacterium]|nr:rhodanese-like domain-containing protein [Bryobacteraceae bacterium]